MLADMAMRIEAARQLVYAAAAKAERGEPDLTWPSAAAKVFASDTAMAVTTDAVQLFGGYGYTRDFPVERMMRDAKITQIYEGTNQIQRIVMAKQMLAARRPRSRGATQIQPWRTAYATAWVRLRTFSRIVRSCKTFLMVRSE